MTERFDTIPIDLPQESIEILVKDWLKRNISECSYDLVENPEHELDLDQLVYNAVLNEAIVAALKRQLQHEFPNDFNTGESIDATSTDVDQ